MTRGVTVVKGEDSQETYRYWNVSQVYEIQKNKDKTKSTEKKVNIFTE